MYIEKDDVSKKNATVVAVLCLFFGSLGVHRFYVGKNMSGLLYLLFGSSLFGVQLFSKLFSFKGTLISIFIFILVVVAVFYDLFAIFTECFLDSKDKIILSGSRQDELVGRTFEEKFNDGLIIISTILMFIVFAILYYLFIINLR